MRFSLFLVLALGLSARAQERWNKISSPEYAAAVTPKDNPASDAKIKLGEKLFNEKRMSANGKVACATCHEPARAFTDGKPLAVGVAKTARNSPSAMNAMFSSFQFWDGRALTLEDQAKLPVTNPLEHGLKDGAAAEAIIRGLPEYKPLFKAAFGSEDVDFDRIAMAIASFERTLISTPAPFDKFLQGNGKAISASAKRGWSLFNGQGRCISCHGMNQTGAFFTDNKFHNIGIAAHKKDFADLAQKALAVVETGNEDQIDELAIGNPNFTELGRFLVTKNPADAGAFKTPTLRNIMVTGPYMHDGSLNTLWDVMDHYNKGGVANPFLDGGMHRLGLSEAQIDDLVAFMATLTSPEFKKAADREFAKQRALSRSKRPERDVALAMGKKANTSTSDAVLPQTGKDPAMVGGRPFSEN
jgi:cytochrome c peroxidase